MHVVKAVKPLEKNELLITFETGEEKHFDVTPYLNKGIFKELESPDYFRQVTVFLDSITWPNGQDFDPDYLFSESY